MDNLFDKIKSPFYLKTERLTIEDILECDRERYSALYLDEELNKWWGYDYREDLKDGSPTPEYFYWFQNSLKEKKEEYSLAVKKDGMMIGELVLHNFGADGSVEMGFRFFKDCQGKGYAIESASALKEFVFNELKATKLKSRCFKQNKASNNLILKMGLAKCCEDATHYYFELKKH